jgi:hypothetical protein
MKIFLHTVIIAISLATSLKIAKEERNQLLKNLNPLSNMSQFNPLKKLMMLSLLKCHPISIIHK